MAIVTKTRTYLTGDSLPANYYNADRDEIIAGINSIDNAQIAAASGILESKVAFNSGGGHRHSGAAGDGRKVLVNTLDVTGLTANYVVRVNSGGTALEAVASTTLATLVTSLDPTGLTANLPLVINAGGTAVTSRTLVNADINAAAAIIESKLLFDATTGHNHNGINSRNVTTVNLSRSFVFVDYQDLIVENNVGVNPIVEVNTNFTAIYAYVKTAPVGAAIIATITLTDLTLVGSITIPAGQNFASAVISTTVTAGTFLQLNVTQVGSTTAGSKLSVTISGLTV